MDSRQVNRPSSGAASKSLVERDKEMDKLRAKSRDEAKKADEKERTAAAQEERCKQANERLRSLVEGGRIWKYDDKGERTVMDDQEIETERGKAQKLVEEACKKS